MLRSRAVEPLKRPQMSNANVLVDIYIALQRLESSLEDQHVRIRNIEGSIRSNTSSPILDGFSSIANSMAKGKDLPDLPRPATPPSASHDGYAASEYEASVRNLSKRRFDFIDDSCSDLQYGGTATTKENDEEIKGTILPAQPHVENPDISGPSAEENQNIKHAAYLDYSDTYSQSVYSSRPLSRFELDIPSMPPLPENSYQAPARNLLHDTSTILVDSQKVRRSVSVRTLVNALSASLSSIQSRKSWSSRRSKSRSSSSSTESSGRRLHERTEMAFYAYDNLKGSVRSSMSLRSNERRAGRAEAKRLQSLSPVSRSGIDLCTVPVEKKEFDGKEGLRMLYSLFVRAFGTDSSKYYPERVSIVA